MTEHDLNQLKEHGLSHEAFDAQLARFRSGFPIIPILRPALLNDGIRKFSDDELGSLARLYLQALSSGINVTKFVPASGAASRMFRNLLAYLHGDENQYSEAKRFCENLHRFAFYSLLKENCPELQQLIEARDYRSVIDQLLLAPGLNYSRLPKALLPFFSYPGGFRTALEEHLAEAVDYIGSQEGTGIHFTVSNEHLELFKKEHSRIREESGGKWADFKIGFSTQDPSTDTIAVSMQNEPFRQDSGKLLFRPGGHGALLKNLDAFDADLVFIKNVDNVLPDDQKPLMIQYKKAIGGLLLQEQSKIFNYIIELQANPTEVLLQEILWYLKTIGLQSESDKLELPYKQQYTYLLKALDRPLRVCSVIRPDRPTGGGPFWVTTDDNDCRLQIVENAQLDATHQSVASQSQYAHITDMVCGLRNYRAEKFNLFDFVDPQTGFITEKSFQGQAIKALEHPGLWNGSMAGWNTILVEIPLKIFRPVKMVWDLWESNI